MKRYFSLHLMLGALLLAAPVYADAQLAALIDNLHAEYYDDAVLQSYQKRLLTLLPRIQAGESVDTVLMNANGTTALHNACGLSHLEIVRWLVAHGANTNARTAKGATVAMCVGGPNAKAINKILQSKPASPVTKAGYAPNSVAHKTVKFLYNDGNTSSFTFGKSNRATISREIPPGYGNFVSYTKTGSNTARIEWAEWEFMGTYIMTFTSPTSGTATATQEGEGTNEHYVNVAFTIK